MSDSLFSRIDLPNPFGECTELAETLLPFSIREGLRRMAQDSGKSEQEYLCDVLITHVLGVDVVIKIYEERLVRVMNVVLEKDTSKL